MPKRKHSETVAPATSKSAGGSKKKTGPTGNLYKTPTDFECTRNSDDGKSYNFVISSWNVNGLKAWFAKDKMEFFRKQKPQVFCLQETKCATDAVPAGLVPAKFFATWNSAEKKGYSGTAILSSTKPVSTKLGIGVSKHDTEGRVITAEYDQFYLVNAYVPNSGRGLPRLNYRTKEWDVDFIGYLKSLDEKKPVILCGDLNVAHKEIDLKNPSTNHRTAGFTDEERHSFGQLLDKLDFVDTFRHLYPDVTGAYTFWSYMGNARASDVGWRLDYFLVSRRLLSKVCDVQLMKKVGGSDHCPLTIYLAL